MEELLLLIPTTPTLGDALHCDLLKLSWWTHPLRRITAARIQAVSSGLSHGALCKNERGRNLLFYMNKVWYTDFAVLKRWCSPHSDTPIINCNLFYSPLLVSFGYHLCPTSGLCNRGITATSWSDNRRGDRTPCSSCWGFLTEQKSPTNSQITGSIYTVPPDTAANWTTATLLWRTLIGVFPLLLQDSLITV